MSPWLVGLGDHPLCICHLINYPYPYPYVVYQNFVLEEKSLRFLDKCMFL